MFTESQHKDELVIETVLGIYVIQASWKVEEEWEIEEPTRCDCTNRKWCNCAKDDDIELIDVAVDELVVLEAEFVPYNEKNELCEASYPIPPEMIESKLFRDLENAAVEYSQDNPNHTPTYKEYMEYNCDYSDCGEPEWDGYDPTEGDGIYER